jgi:hypothetical protein
MLRFVLVPRLSRSVDRALSIVVVVNIIIHDDNHGGVIDQHPIVWPPRNSGGSGDPKIHDLCPSPRISRGSTQQCTPYGLVNHRKLCDYKNWKNAVCSRGQPNPLEAASALIEVVLAGCTMVEAGQSGIRCTIL